MNQGNNNKTGPQQFWSGVDKYWKQIMVVLSMSVLAITAWNTMDNRVTQLEANYVDITSEARMTNDDLRTVRETVIRLEEKVDFLVERSTF